MSCRRRSWSRRSIATEDDSRRRRWHPDPVRRATRLRRFISGGFRLCLHLHRVCSFNLLLQQRSKLTYSSLLAAPPLHRKRAKEYTPIRLVHFAPKLSSQSARKVTNRGRPLPKRRSPGSGPLATPRPRHNLLRSFAALAVEDDSAEDEKEGWIDDDGEEDDMETPLPEGRLVWNSDEEDWSPPSPTVEVYRRASVAREVDENTSSPVRRLAIFSITQHRLTHPCPRRRPVAGFRPSSSVTAIRPSAALWRPPLTPTRSKTLSTTSTPAIPRASGRPAPMAFLSYGAARSRTSSPRPKSSEPELQHWRTVPPCQTSSLRCRSPRSRHRPRQGVVLCRRRLVRRCITSGAESLPTGPRVTEAPKPSPSRLLNPPAHTSVRKDCRSPPTSARCTTRKVSSDRLRPGPPAFTPPLLLALRLLSASLAPRLPVPSLLLRRRQQLLILPRLAFTQTSGLHSTLRSPLAGSVGL